VTILKNKTVAEPRWPSVRSYSEPKHVHNS